MMNLTRTARALMGAGLVAGGLGACDLEPIASNPNEVPASTLPQLFTSIQVNNFFWNENIVARLAAMWTNQMAGTDRQFSIMDQYIIDEGTAGGEYGAVYFEGGLVSIKPAKVVADEIGCRVCAGILKVHEAYLIGSAADTWGDIPYTEAVNPDIAQPALDEQLTVYAMIQDTLNAAIADLQSGEIGGGIEFLNSDFNFDGDPAAWAQVAHSLKARYFMHVAEVDPSAYERAITEAQQGIDTPANNFRSIHTNAGTETNIWHQFTRDRSGYISGGYYLIHLLNGGTPDDFSDDDPRLPIYFDETNGVSGFEGPVFFGSPPGNPAGDPGQNASQLRRDPGFPGGADYDQTIIGCAETQFIIAEAALATGNPVAAQTAYEAGIECQEAEFGVEIEAELLGVGGDALRQVMEQKYIALFLNFETLNDYRRTCLPLPGTVNGRPIPGRLFYGSNARETNDNIPPPAEQPEHNDNNPDYPCPSQPFPFPLP